WYDEGIPPTDKWKSAIIQAIKKCHIFMVFLSEQSVTRPNVIREVDFALKRYDEGQIWIFPFFLENIILPDELQFSLGPIQGIFKPNFREDQFYDKIYTQITKKIPYFSIPIKQKLHAPPKPITINPVPHSSNKSSNLPIKKNSNKLFNDAIQDANLAISLDKQREYERAIDLYTLAHVALTQFSTTCKNKVLRDLAIEKADQYMQRATTLKKFL
ncbi:MAG: TIR domain-containing protein, partial [Promethearchaeota archaeon]